MHVDLIRADKVRCARGVIYLNNCTKIDLLCAWQLHLACWRLSGGANVDSSRGKIVDLLGSLRARTLGEKLQML
jgi:hypothetical protein